MSLATFPATSCKILLCFFWNIADFLDIIQIVRDGKLGDGSQADDGIYVLIKEVVDNSVDEFIMGRRQADRRDGRGRYRDCPRLRARHSAQVPRCGRQRDEYRRQVRRSAFKKTVGLNGVGVKAVNMLSSEFTARSVRDGEARTVTFAQGLEQSDRWESGVQEKKRYVYQFPCGPGGVR